MIKDKQKTRARGCLVPVIGFLLLMSCESSNLERTTPGDTDVDTSTDTGSEKDTDTGTGPSAYSKYRIEPANSILETELNTTNDVPFTVSKFIEGSEGKYEDITSRVVFSCENEDMGTFTGNTLNMPAFAEVGAHTSVIRGWDPQEKKPVQTGLTVAAYRMSGTEQDFFFILPFEDKKMTQTKPLTFSTDVPKMDIVVDMDSTTSMRPAQVILQHTMRDRIIPGILKEVEDTYFAVTQFHDFPIAPYGWGGEELFTLLTPITNDKSKIEAGVNGFFESSGADIDEAQIESFYQIATGNGMTIPDTPVNVPPYTGAGRGGVGFREGSMPVILVITDAGYHTLYSGDSYQDYTGQVAEYAHGRDETLDKLHDLCARVVGVVHHNGMEDTRWFANLTGAAVPPISWGPQSERPLRCDEGECCTGLDGEGQPPNEDDGLCPIVYQMLPDGSGLDDSFVYTMQLLAKFAAFDVNTRTLGETADAAGTPLPNGVTTADFIKDVIPKLFTMPEKPKGLPEPEIDGRVFENVTPGTFVTFNVDAYNDVVEGTNDAQFFRATIKVLAGDCLPVDERVVLILVPPNPIFTPS